MNNEQISKRDVEERIEPLILARLEAFRREKETAGQWNDAAQRAWNEIYFPEFRGALRTAVRERLMLQEAREKKLDVDQGEFLRRRERILAELREGGQSARQGVSTHEVEARLRRQMLLEEFSAQLVTALDLPNRRDVEAYYRQHQTEYRRPATARVRLIRVDGRKTDALGRAVRVEDPRGAAEGLREEVLRNGGDFAELAREKSDDELSRARGGLLLSPDGEEFLDPEENRLLGPALRGLKPGSAAERLSPVFEMGERRWAIAYLEERRPASPRPLDEKLYRKIYELLVREVVVRKEDEWFRQAVARSLILTGDANPKLFPKDFFFPNATPAVERTTPGKDEPRRVPPEPRER